MLAFFNIDFFSTDYFYKTKILEMIKEIAKTDFCSEICFTSIKFSIFDEIGFFWFRFFLEFSVYRRKFLLLVDLKLIEFSKYVKIFWIWLIILELWRKRAGGTIFLFHAWQRVKGEVVDIIFGRFCEILFLFRNLKSPKKL